MRFKIVDRAIYYTDRKWKTWICCLPKEESFIRKVLSSRNKIPRKIIEMFNLSEEEMKEYESAKTEDELADNIIKDCKKNGITLIKREKQ